MSSGTTSPDSGDQPQLFLDRSLGSHTVPELLRNKGYSVIIHDDIFDQDTEDVVWLPEVSDRGWIIVTKDKNIRYNTLEKRAVANTGAKMFVIATKKNLTGKEMGELFCEAMIE